MQLYYSSSKYGMISHDITNHCNARCKFCFNDWDKLQPCNMTSEIFRKSREIIPLCSPQSFLLACLFEPTLNPEFFDILKMIPTQYSDYIFFTTNLVKRLTDEELEQMVTAPVSYFNVSLETFKEERYGILSGTKNSAFYDNLRRLTDIAQRTGNSRKIRIITMILRSNQDELVELVKRVHDELHPSVHEIRTPYISSPIESFLKDEMLTRDELGVLVSDISSLGYQNLSLDLGRDANILEKHIEVKNELEKSGAAGLQAENRAHRVRIEPNGLETLDGMKMNGIKGFTYRVRINSDGTGYFMDTDEFFDLKSIDEPLLFFSSHLSELTDKDARQYIIPPSEPYSIEYQQDRIQGEAQDIIVTDHAFMTLRGWFMDVQDANRNGRVVFLAEPEGHGILLQTQQTVRSGAAASMSSSERNTGFLCKIPSRELKPNASYHLLAGYKEGQKLYLKDMGALPPISQFI